MKPSYVNVDDRACIHLMPIPGDKVWIVTSVGVQRHKRGRGAASRLLDEVLREADNEQVLLVLSVVPDGSGLNYFQLIDFYSRHGFVELAGTVADTGLMYRNPHGARLPVPTWLACF